MVIHHQCIYGKEMSVQISQNSYPAKRKAKIVVGAVGIAFLILFTILAIIGIISFIEWILGDAAVALVANLIFKRLGTSNR
jgi:hypothetical protein